MISLENADEGALVLSRSGTNVHTLAVHLNHPLHRQAVVVARLLSGVKTPLPPNNTAADCYFRACIVKLGLDSTG